MMMMKKMSNHSFELLKVRLKLLRLLIRNFYSGEKIQMMTMMMRGLMKKLE